MIARRLGDGLSVDSSVGSIQTRPSLQKVRKGLKKWRASIYNRWEPHDKAGRYVRRLTKATFNKQQTVEGKAWPALKPATIKRKLRSKNLLHDPSKALLHTGKLKRSIRYKVFGVRRFGAPRALSGGGSKATVTRISPETSGRRMVEARVQQGRGLGTFIRAGPGRSARIPSRPYMGMSDHMVGHIQKIFVDYISHEMIKHVVKLGIRG